MIQEIKVTRIWRTSTIVGIVLLHADIMETTVCSNLEPLQTNRPLSLSLDLSISLCFFPLSLSLYYRLSFTDIYI